MNTQVTVCIVFTSGNESVFVSDHLMLIKSMEMEEIIREVVLKERRKPSSNTVQLCV